jgi:four helix bundle protein
LFWVQFSLTTDSYFAGFLDLKFWVRFAQGRDPKLQIQKGEIMKNFKTYQLAKKLYQDCKCIPIKGEIRDQLERATLSVCLNLSEGSAKDGKDRVRFYKIAFGSLRETQAILDLIDHQDLMQLADSLAAHLFKLIQNPGKGPILDTVTVTAR